MIATDFMHCNHHHYISVIWVHLEKLVDEIAARTHWSGTPPLPLPLLCRPPFLQVNGTAAQQHFMILSSSPWPLSPGSPRTSSEPSRSSSPWSPSPDQPHQGGDERPAAAWVHRPGRLLQQEPLLSCQVSLLARHKFLKVMTFFPSYLYFFSQGHGVPARLLCQANCGSVVEYLGGRSFARFFSLGPFFYLEFLLLVVLGRPSLCQVLFIGTILLFGISIIEGTWEAIPLSVLFFQLPSTPPS